MFDEMRLLRQLEEAGPAAVREGLANNRWAAFKRPIIEQWLREQEHPDETERVLRRRVCEDDAHRFIDGLNQRWLVRLALGGLALGAIALVERCSGGG